MSKPIYIWDHYVGDKKVGEIRRLPDSNGGKSDLPFYVFDNDKWKAGAHSVPRPLFGINSLKNTQAPLIICEGQKVATAWLGLGYQCVSLVGGAFAYDKADWASIGGARRVWFAPEMKVIRLPGLKQKGDLCDWLKLQPELADWNELDPLFGRPDVAALRQRLDDTIAQNSRLIEWTPWDEWKTPVPIDTRLRPVRRWPLAVIPPPIRARLCDVQRRIGCPLEYLVIPAIIGAGAAIGTSCTIRPKRKAPWPVTPNNFGAVIGPPSTLKTAAIEAAIEPLEAIDSERFAEFQASREEHDKAKFVHDQKLAALKEQGKSAARGNKRTAIEETPEDVAERLETAPKPPALKRTIIKDATKEAITQILAVNPRGVLIYLDELVQLIAGWDKEGRQGERQFHLQGWNGNQPYTVDRASFPEGQRIPKLCESIIGGMQPDTLKQYLVDMGESSNDGMIQRFQLLIYLDSEDNLEDDDQDDYEDEEAKRAYTLVFKELSTADWTTMGAIPLKDAAPYYRFNDEIELDERGGDPDTAQNLWDEWSSKLKEKVKDEENVMIAQHLAKYKSLMPSLALIFHLMEIASRAAEPGPVTRASTQLAIDWCALLEEHARRIYEMSKPMDLVITNALAQKVKAKKLGDRFNVRDVQRKCWSSLKKSSDIMNACRQLSELNWLRVVHTQNDRGGPPKVEFLVNPEVIDDKAN